MTSETLLWRQIHPTFVQCGRVTSQAFRPTEKDQGRLSAYDGDQIDDESAWRHYTMVLGYKSCGAMALCVAECMAHKLPVEADGEGYPEHVSISFAGLTNSQWERVARRLREAAVVRGWKYQLTTSTGQGGP